VGVGANPQALAYELGKGYSAKIRKAFDSYLPRTKAVLLPDRSAAAAPAPTRVPARTCTDCGRLRHIVSFARGSEVCGDCVTRRKQATARAKHQAEREAADWGHVLDEMFLVQLRLDNFAAQLLPFRGVGGR
jgi:hypothetical protein